MDLSTYKCKIILLLTHSAPPQSSVLLLPNLLKHFPSPAISFFPALKPTFSLFPTLHNFSAFPSFPAPSRPANFNQAWLRTNAIKHLRMHHHLRVSVLRELYKVLLYFTYFIRLWMVVVIHKIFCNWHYGGWLTHLWTSVGFHKIFHIAVVNWTSYGASFHLWQNVDWK